MRRRERMERDDRARFMWGAFASVVRQHRAGDPRGGAAVAADVGITANDLSRVMGGSNVEVSKVLALCIWMRRNPLEFYLSPDHVSRADCFTFTPVETTENTSVSRQGGAV